MSDTPPPDREPEAPRAPAAVSSPFGQMADAFGGRAGFVAALVVAAAVAYADSTLFGGRLATPLLFVTLGLALLALVILRIRQR